jgi:hypothetical protein
MDIASFWVNPRKGRLHAEIQNMQRSCAVDNPEGEPHAVSLELQGHLTDASAAYGRGDINAAWLHLFRARERYVLHCRPEQLASLARTVSAETTDAGKFTPWRRLAIAEQLSMFKDDGSVESRESLHEALRLRNEGISNQYWRLSLGRHYQLALLAAGAPTLLAVVVLMARSLENMKRAEWAMGEQAFILCVLLGVLGATTSAAQRTARGMPRRIPFQLGAGISSLSRVPIGAIAGLTVWLFSMAATTGGSVVAANMLLAAFGAGFAERLAVQSNRSTDRSAIDSEG